MLVPRALALFLAAAALAAMAAAPHAQERAPVPAAVIAQPPGLPAIGKWMIGRDGAPAHWLGQMLGGKRLHEPVNIIFVDAGAAGAGDASRRLVAALVAAGYPARFGHSTGYRGWIGGALYGQLPHGRDEAFSNRVFELSNNHGRVFGPHPHDGAFVFTGAFSRERVNLLARPAHRYESFTRARDDLARRLAAGGTFRPAGRVPLGNAIAGDPALTTGDHDGMAVLLRAE